MTEIIAFPAGGIAAIIIATIVVLMVLIKIVCVLTGYESRLPDIDLDDDEHKQILDSASEPIVHVKDGDTPGKAPGNGADNLKRILPQN